MKLLIILALCCALNAGAQNRGDEEALKMLVEHRYAMLDNALNDSTSFSPAMRLRAKAIVAARQRRFEESNTLIEQLLSSQELAAATPPDVLSELAAMLGTNFRHAGDYSSVADLYGSFAEQYPDDQTLAHAADYFKGWASQPRTTFERTSQMVEIPFHIDSAYRGQILRIEAEVNGRTTKMIFDTGCAEISFADEQFAHEHNLRDTGITLTANGVGKGTIRLAIADSIRVGGLILRNALFGVSSEEGIKTQDGSLFRIGGVLGCNFILAAEVFEFDNQTQTIRFPAPEYVVHDDKSANMWMDERGLFYIDAEVGEHPVTMQFDSGNAKTNLTSIYYKKYSDEVKASGERGTVSKGGFGGTVIGEGFYLPTVQLCIDGTTTTLHNTQVTPDIAGIHEGEEDGSLGVDFLTAYPRIRVNYKAMHVSVHT